MFSETRGLLHTSRPLLRRSLPSGPALAGLREQTDTHVPPRRQELRVPEAKMCTYSLCEVTTHEQVVIHQGDAHCINRSQQGILVLMGARPRESQLLEIHLAESRWRHSMNVYEVQWTKSVTIEAQGELYLAGCRLVFRPPQYWKF